MVRFYRIFLVLLLVFLLPTSALAIERFRVNVRADLSDENVGAEFEYNLSYKVYIDGGIGITLGAIDRIRVSAGFKYYLWEPDEKVYFRIHGITYFKDTSITRFKLGIGVGYTTYLDRTRSSIEVGVLVGFYSGTLDIKPTLGVSVSVSR
ncbi:MAG: hypothetical protein N2380_02625 [bacterium]|nr:hypothetical protein [bacterium]